MEERRQYHGGFVWPVALIGAGIVFLLNNLGVIGWDIWRTLVQLWPVLLIAVGIDILVGRRFPLGSALLALLLVGVLALSVSGTAPTIASARYSPAVERTETVAQPLEGATSATVRISFSAGAFNIGALPADNGSLIEGTVDLSRGESLRTDYRGTGDARSFTLESVGSWTSGPELLVEPEGKSWDLTLNRDIPLDLRINAGAGKSMLDLTNLNLRRFELDGGVGQMTVKLPVAGKYDVQVDGGVGQMIVMMPEGLAARVQVDSGLGGVTTQGDFTRQGDDYVVGDYANATNRATVRIDGGVGQIVLKTISE